MRPRDWCLLVSALTLAVVIPVASGQVRGLTFGRPTPIVRPSVPAVSLEVVDYGPTGEVTQALRMVKVRFDRPVVAFASTDMHDAGDALRVRPLVPGRSTWRGADLLLFEAADAFPPATRFEVSVDPSLAAYDGGKLARPLRWQFETVRPRCEAFTLLEGGVDVLGPGDPVPLRCNLPISSDGLARVVSAKVDGRPWPIRAGLLEQEEPAIRNWCKQLEANHSLRYLLDSQPSQQNGIVIWPGEPWPAGGRVQITLAKGLSSSAGPLPSKTPTEIGLLGSPMPAVISARCEGALEILWNTRLRETESGRISVEPRTQVAGWFPSWRRDEDAKPPIWVAVYSIPQPGATYQIGVPAGLVDVYGRKLETAWTRRVTCEVPAPRKDLWLSEQQGTLEAKKPWTIGIESSLVPSARLRVVALDPNTIRARPDAYSRALAWWEAEKGGRHLPDDDEKHPAPTLAGLGGDIVERQVDLDAQPKEWNGLPVDLAKVGNGRPGLFAVSLEGASVPERRGLFQVSDLGLVGWLGAGRSAVQVVRLSTGEVVPGAEVRASADGKSFLKLGQADGHGLALFGAWPGEKPASEGLMFLARSQADQVLLAIDEIYRVGHIETGRHAGEDIAGELVSERDLYLRGEDVYFVGWAAMETTANQDGLRVLPSGTQATVELGNADRNVAEGTARLDARGKFWGVLALPKDAPLGKYYLSATIERAGDPENPWVIRAQGIHVAAFRAAEVDVDAHVNDKEFFPGQTPRLEVKARHLYGGLAQLTAADIGRTCRPYFFTSQAAGWHVGPRRDFRTLAQRDSFAVAAKEFARGVFSLDLPTLPSHPYLPTECHVDITVRDEALRSTSTEVRFRVHPTRFYLGMRWKEDAGKLKVEVQGLNPEARPVAVRDILITLRDREDERIVRSVRVEASKAKPAETIFANLAEGAYLLSAEAVDDERRVFTSDAAYVAPASAKPAEQAPEPEPLTLRVAHRARVGEVLTVRLEAGKGVRTGAVAVMRGGLREVRTVYFANGLGQVELPVQEGWVPGVKVEATAVLPSSERPVRLSRQEARVEVEVEHRRLQVRVTGPKKAEPNQEVSYEVRVQNPDVRPAPEAHLSAWAVDEGVLSLTGYEAPDPIRAFALESSDGVESVDSLSDVIAPYDPKPGVLGKRRALTPGVIPGAADVRGEQPGFSLRENFQTTPFFLGDAKVDATGMGRLRFRLPHNLTRYRITVIASAPLRESGAPARFGIGTATVEVGIPVLLRPLIPRFLRVGDRGEAVVVAHNRSGKPGSLDITLAVNSAEKNPVLLVSGESKRSIALAVGEEKRLPFLIDAKAAGQAILRWTSRVRARDGSTFTDAVQLPLNVIAEPTPIDRVAMGGTVAAGQRLEIPTQLPEAAAKTKEQGQLIIRLASSPVDDLEEVVSALVRYPYTCAEQTMSRLLPFLVKPDLATRLANESVQKATSKALDRLHELRVSNGWGSEGVGYWPGETEIDLFASAWALLVLDYASDEAAEETPKASLGSALGARYSSATEKLRGKTTALASLVALAMNEAGGRFAFANPEADKARTPLATGLAALALTAADRRASAAVRKARFAQARTWLSEATTRIPEHSQIAHIEDAYVERGFPSATPAMAEAALAWAFARAWPEHPAVGKLMRAVAEHRKGGAWENTLENAFVLLAAHELEKRGGGKPDRRAEIVIEGKATHVQLGKLRPSWEQTLALSALPDSFFAPPNLSPALLGLVAGKEGDLFFGLDASYPAANPDAAVDDGFAIQRRFRFPTQAEGDLQSAEVGALLAVDVILKARMPLEHVAVEVPLPAGLEAVDPRFPSDALGIPAAAVRHADLFVAHSELLPEKTLLFLRHVSAGEMRYTFFIRALVPGLYGVPGPRVQAMYAPEVRGRGRTVQFTVRPVVGGT